MSPAWEDAKQQLAAAMRSNPTSAEAVLWDRLKRKPGGFTFWNQHVIRGWIADFYCPAARLVIEVDGSSHRGREAQDQLRDEVMRAYRFGVVRFANSEVHQDVDIVVGKIVAEVLQRGGRRREDEMAARRLRLREAAAQGRRETVAEPDPTPVVRVPRTRVEYVPGRPTKARFRCTWCLQEWVAAVRDVQRCHRCPYAEVDRLCKTCNLRVAHPRILACATCYEASRAARDAVGNGNEQYGQGRHRARKLL